MKAHYLNLKYIIALTDNRDMLEDKTNHDEEERFYETQTMEDVPILTCNLAAL